MRKIEISKYAVLSAALSFWWAPLPAYCMSEASVRLITQLSQALIISGPVSSRVSSPEAILHNYPISVCPLPMRSGEIQQNMQITNINADPPTLASTLPNFCFTAVATGVAGTRVAGDVFAIDCNNNRNF